MMFFESIFMFLAALVMLLFGGFLNMGGSSHMDGFWR